MSTLHKLTSPPQLLENPNLSGMGKSDVGIEVNGAGHIIRDVTASGGYQGILFDGATEDCIVDGYKHTAIGPAGYGLYFSSGNKSKPNARHIVRDVSISIEKGESGAHCVRVYATEELHAVDWKLRHYGTFPGHPLNFRQGAKCTFENLKTWGRCLQFGPDKKASELSYRVTEINLIGGEINLNDGWLSATDEATLKHTSPLVFWSGVTKIRAYGTKIIEHNPRKAILRCEASYGTRPEASDIILYECPLIGGSKIIDGGNVDGIKLVDCTWNGHRA